VRKISCCSQEVKVSKQGEIFVYRCPMCKKQSEGKTPAEAVEKWEGLFEGKQIEKKETSVKQKAYSIENKNMVIIRPSSPEFLTMWAQQNFPDLLKKSASFQDKPSTTRMIQKNIDYVASHRGLTECWKTEEGQDSIVRALEDSFWMGAMLPEMGSIVPYGSTCEFIPAVEAFNFALTTGNNNPFEKIDIIVIHKNDIHDIGRRDGQFYCNIKQGFPRGEVIGVVVTGLRSDGITVGESYDVNRLLEKAKTHSPSYKQYLRDRADFDTARTEGTTKRDGNREYIVKKMFKKGGETWDKKIYIDDLVSPYEGADQAEMLRKSAGKSFLNPYMKIRNSMSMANEWGSEETDGEKMETTEKKIDTILQTAKANVNHAEKVEEIFEGEIITEGDDRI
jgi:hypothetical protein